MDTEKKIFYALVTLGMLLATFILYSWVKQPSPWASERKPDTEYTKCLELVLRNGNIADANEICKDLKGRN
jgi:hypothetical protein